MNSIIWCISKMRLTEILNFAKIRTFYLFAKEGCNNSLWASNFGDKLPAKHVTAVLWMIGPFPLPLRNTSTTCTNGNPHRIEQANVIRKCRLHWKTKESCVVVVFAPKWLRIILCGAFVCIGRIWVQQGTSTGPVSCGLHWRQGCEANICRMTFAHYCMRGGSIYR